MFRLDRFESHKLTGIKLSDPPIHTLKEFRDRNLSEEKDLTEVTVLFAAEVVRYIGDSKYRHGWAWEEEVEGGLEMTFLTSHPEYLARWMLIWGDGAKILQPKSVKEKAKELVTELYTQYKP